MKTLLLLRHAKSSWKAVSLDDHERPLNKRGTREAPRTGRLLKVGDRLPNRILTSTAKRALRTADIVAQASGYDGEIVRVPDLYAADTATLLAVARDHGNDAARLLVVAHNPGLEMLVEHVTGCKEELPTATLVEIALPIDAWSELNERVKGTLVSVWRPRELRL
jgi:phosphohistidine phosphatase